MVLEAGKYYSTMDDRQLHRILKNDLLSASHKVAMRRLLEERQEREDCNAEQQRFLQTEMDSRKKRKPGRMFPNTAKLTSGKGRIRQGGKASPR
jgi:hypothetical protein